MAKQTTFATPWEAFQGEGRRCLSDGTVFTHDVCPTCNMRARLAALLRRVDAMEAA